MLQTLVDHLKGWKLYTVMVFGHDGYICLSMELCLSSYLSGFSCLKKILIVSMSGSYGMCCAFCPQVIVQSYA